MVRLRFFHPEGAFSRPRIWPVFLPRAGCPGRCVFCDQAAQTGRGEADLAGAHARLSRELEGAARAGKGPFEIGFYGGTFTALPEGWPERFVALAGEYLGRGVVSAVRCSTRPDALDEALLERLAGLGLGLVELGAQSFDPKVLRLAGRGHGPEATMAACGLVRRAGLGLGLQLLPGLPGQTPADFAADALAVARISPDIVRIHPCLVLRGTGLEAMFRGGAYRPWELGETVEVLAAALPSLWRAGVRVARLGLAPEPSLETAVVAGPRHPALGTMVRARALYLMLGELLNGARAARLFAPRRYLGEIFGHARELAPAYAGLGLDRGAVTGWDEPYFDLECPGGLKAAR